MLEPRARLEPRAKHSRTGPLKPTEPANGYIAQFFDLSSVDVAAKLSYKGAPRRLKGDGKLNKWLDQVVRDGRHCGNFYI